MWNVKTNAIPVIIGASGTILKSFIKIPEQHIGPSLQKMLKTADLFSTGLHTRSTKWLSLSNFALR
jgi:hypothetical protein